MNIYKFHQIVEKLSELEHNQWVEWSKEIALRENISEERLFRWQDECWKPYKELSENQKKQDRKYAFKIIEVLSPYISDLREDD